MHMLTLKEAVTAFQAEISGAVAGLAAGWQTERVTLTLEVVSDAHGALRVAGPAAEGGRGHRVCIEFRVGAPGAPFQPAAGPAAAGGTSPTPGASSGVAALLGAPGFDSSARAAVLCEVLEGLTEKQVAALPDALLLPADKVKDPELRRARHLILGIVQSGPLKSAERAADLLRTALRSQTASALIAAVQATWATDDNW